MNMVIAPSGPGSGTRVPDPDPGMLPDSFRFPLRPGRRNRRQRSGWDANHPFRRVGY
jgi:hypothetical protein